MFYVAFAIIVLMVVSLIRGYIWLGEQERKLGAPMKNLEELN